PPSPGPMSQPPGAPRHRDQMTSRGELLDTSQYTEYRPLMFSIAYRMTGSVSDAEDIVQEAFLRADKASRASRASKTANTSKTANPRQDRNPKQARQHRPGQKGRDQYRDRHQGRVAQVIPSHDPPPPGHRSPPLSPRPSRVLHRHLAPRAAP